MLSKRNVITYAIAFVFILLLNLQEQRGLSMLYITHDVATARKVSDRIAVMLDGKIIEEVPSNEIIAAPQKSYTKSLLSAASALHSTESRGIEQQTLSPPRDEEVL
jgi:peptide/nickel transport system ATP-binding protein